METPEDENISRAIQKKIQLRKLLQHFLAKLKKSKSSRVKRSSPPDDAAVLLGEVQTILNMSRLESDEEINGEGNETELKEGEGEENGRRRRGLLPPRHTHKCT